MSGDVSEVRLFPVGQLGEVRMGKQLSPTSRTHGRQLPYLRVANVFEGYIDYSDVKSMGFSDAEATAYRLKPGDILLNEGQENLAVVGRSAIYGGQSGQHYFQNTLIRFRPGPFVVSEYAQAVFEWWRRHGVFAKVAEKTSISHLGSSRFAKLPFPVIPLNKQRRIVELLHAVAERERAIEASIAKLRIIRRGSLMAAMSSIASSHPKQGWKRTPLMDVVPSVDYGISEPLTRNSGGIPTLRMNNLRDGRPSLGDLRYCAVSVPRRLLLRRNDVLFNRTNSIEHVGRAGIWKGELREATFASYLVRLNPDVTRLLPEYLVEWLQHPLIRQRVRAIATVAVQQVNVNPSRLRELVIDFPACLDSQQRIATTLTLCDEQITQEVAQLEKMRAMKQAITEDLLSGNVRVGEPA